MPQNTPCNERTLPVMYIKPETKKKRTKQYKRIKHRIIKDPKREFIDVAVSEFTNLLGIIINSTAYNGMRIYFAAYKVTPNYSSNQYIQSENLMTFVFVPTEEKDSFKRNDSQKYLTLDGNNAVQSIDRLTASAWISNFRETTWKILCNSSHMTGHEETRSIWYDKIALKELFEMITDCAAGVIDKIRLSFCAYMAGEKVHISQTTSIKVRNQLSLIITVLDSHYKEIDWKFFGFLLKKNKDFFVDDDYDTGLPCPPSTVCEGSSF